MTGSDYDKLYGIIKTRAKIIVSTRWVYNDILDDDDDDSNDSSNNNNTL